jgi:hypothetical protein
VRAKKEKADATSAAHATSTHYSIDIDASAHPDSRFSESDAPARNVCVELIFKNTKTKAGAQTT